MHCEKGVSSGIGAIDYVLSEGMVASGYGEFNVAFREVWSLLLKKMLVLALG